MGRLRRLDIPILCTNRAPCKEWQSPTNSVLVIATKSKVAQKESEALESLGSVYNSGEAYSKAVVFREQGLAFPRQNKDLRGEDVELGNLGVSYFNLGHSPKPLPFMQRQWRYPGRSRT